MVTVVVSRYNETLEWLDEYPFNQFSYIVYNKGKNNDFAKAHVKQVICLPNVGRCDHTVMYHLVRNYATLSGILVFLPGSIDMPEKKAKASLMLQYILTTKRAAFVVDNRFDVLANFKDFTLDNWTCTHPSNAAQNPERALALSPLRPFGKWYAAHFGDVAADFMTYHGVFSVAATDVLAHPVERYGRILNELAHHSNPEVGHYLERAWAALFFPLRDTDRLLK